MSVTTRTVCLEASIVRLTASLTNSGPADTANVSVISAIVAGSQTNIVPDYV